MINHPFTGKELKQCGLPVPPTGRAYGSLMVKASKENLIIHVGYGHVSNPKAHATPASIWQRAA